MTMKTEQHSGWGFSRKTAGGAQLSLKPSEVHQFNPVPSGIRVLSGVAWITWKGEDIVLNPGQVIRFSPSRSNPIISAVGQGTLVIEMLQ